MAKQTMYVVRVADVPALYPAGYFPRKFKYLKEAKIAAEGAITNGATMVRVECPNGGELDYRPRTSGVKAAPPTVSIARCKAMVAKEDATISNLTIATVPERSTLIHADGRQYDFHPQPERGVVGIRKLGCHDLRTLEMSTEEARTLYAQLLKQGFRA